MLRFLRCVIMQGRAYRGPEGSYVATKTAAEREIEQMSQWLSTLDQPRTERAPASDPAPTTGRRCLMCGTDMTGRAKTAKYCHDNCRVKAWDRKKAAEKAAAKKPAPQPEPPLVPPDPVTWEWALYHLVKATEYLQQPGVVERMPESEKLEYMVAIECMTQLLETATGRPSPFPREWPWQGVVAMAQALQQLPHWQGKKIEAPE